MNTSDKSEFLQFLKKNQAGIYCFDFPVDRKKGFISNLLVRGQGPITEIKESSTSIKFSCINHCFVIRVESFLKFTKSIVVVHESFDLFDSWISVFVPVNRKNEVDDFLKEEGMYYKLTNVIESI